MSSSTATLTYDTLRFGEFEDFPETSEPVWILGKEYNALTGKTSTKYNSIKYSACKTKKLLTKNSVCLYLLSYLDVF